MGRAHETVRRAGPVSLHRWSDGVVSVGLGPVAVRLDSWVPSRLRWFPRRCDRCGDMHLNEPGRRRPMCRPCLRDHRELRVIPDAARLRVGSMNGGDPL